MISSEYSSVFSASCLNNADSDNNLKVPIIGVNIKYNFYLLTSRKDLKCCQFFPFNDGT